MAIIYLVGLILMTLGIDYVMMMAGDAVPSRMARMHSEKSSFI